jgi:hypothetical protein
VESLKINFLSIGFYVNPNKLRENKMWYDDLVAATSYIGPMVEEKSTSASVLRSPPKASARR